MLSPSSSASHGSHKKPCPFHQLCLTSVLNGTCQSSRLPSLRTRKLNKEPPSGTSYLTSPITWRRPRSSTESFYTPVLCSRPAVLTSPAWNASWVPSTVTPLFPITLHVTLMPTFPGGSMHSALQGSPVPSQVQLLSLTNEPSPTPAQVLASTLLLATSGVPGASSQAGKLMEGISDGQKRLASSFLRSLSVQPVSLASSSESLATTAEMVALSQSQRSESIYASSEGTQTHTHTQSKINKVLSFIAR